MIEVNDYIIIVKLLESVSFIEDSPEIVFIEPQFKQIYTISELNQIINN